jgi:hypothetical protein
LSLKENWGSAGRPHFWPFDGLEESVDKPVVAEVYPSLFRRRDRKAGRTADGHDACLAAVWLPDIERRGTLGHHLTPPLSLPKRRQAVLEDWIFGV